MICEVISPCIPDRDMQRLGAVFDLRFRADAAEAEAVRLAEMEEARIAAHYAERDSRLAERVARQVVYTATHQQ